VEDVPTRQAVLLFVVEWREDVTVQHQVLEARSAENSAENTTVPKTVPKTLLDSPAPRVL
jgi:hypothetical protein